MVAAALLLAALAADPMSGTWEGTSLCQVRPSPCRDEHVIYRVTQADAGRHKIDAFKLIDGKEIFMGAIDLQFDPARAQFDGPVIGGGSQVGSLRLIVKGTHLSGRMTRSDGTLYRLIEADKR